MKNVAF